MTKDYLSQEDIFLKIKEIFVEPAPSLIYLQDEDLFATDNEILINLIKQISSKLQLYVHYENYVILNELFWKWYNTNMIYYICERNNYIMCNHNVLKQSKNILPYS